MLLCRRKHPALPFIQSLFVVCVVVATAEMGCADRDSGAGSVRPATADTVVASENSAEPSDKTVTLGSVSEAKPRVMLVSFDGLRPDAISGERTPNLQTLIDGGSSTMTGQSEFPCVTLPNHTCMVTGLSILHHGVFINTSVKGRVQRTTIFDTAKAAGIPAGFFVTKPKLNYLCGESDVLTRVVKTDIDVLADETAAAIRNDDLQLVFLHFGEPDGAGHAHGWMGPEYLEQVHRADAAFGRVLDALRERGFFDDTLFIITADHGGHGKIHGLDIPEDRNVPFIVSGPGIAKSRRICDTMRPMDAAAIALKTLGLSIESAPDGHVPAEIGAEVSALPCKEDSMQNAYVSFCGPFPPMMLMPLGLMMVMVRKRFRRSARQAKWRPRSAARELGLDQQ